MDGVSLAMIGAGFAIGIAAIGSGLGIGIAGAAAAGAVAEDKNNFKNSLILELLPQTQVIYGLIVAFLILYFTGLFGGGAEILPEKSGFVAIGAGLAVGLGGLSAIGQGITCAGGIGAVSKDSSLLTQNIVFGAMSEIAAVFGLAVAILMILFGI
ncbi:MAG: V-type ATP synthase subunit K [Candidatus Methanofastidiosia archaeon]